tara:strand:- start:1069 stop:1287 length:219 start_codon:yes stop_codon:yes gene_type:complete
LNWTFIGSRDAPGAAGAFTICDARGNANETPRTMTVAPHCMSETDITNRAFAAFVRATGHITDAEKSGEGYV